MYKILRSLFGLSIICAASAQAADIFDLAKKGTPDQIQKAINDGYDIKQQNRYGFTLLHVAAERNESPEVLRLLINAGACVDTTTADFASTPLHFAASTNKNPQVITTLINAGADINAKQKGGLTPLCLAVADNDNPQITATLIKAGADVYVRTGDGMTLMHRAASAEIVGRKSQNIVAIMTLLINAGVDVNSKRDDNAETPLHRAASFSSDPKVVTTLIKAGANVNAKCNDGSTPLHSAAERNENPEIISALVKAGANLNAKNNVGMTSLMLAKSKRNTRAIASLLSGGDISTDIFNYAENGTVEQIQKCIRQGTDINCKSFGSTPLHRAAAKNTNPQVIIALLSAGADVKAKNNAGYTPLHLAVSENQSSHIIASLIKAGADVNAKSEFPYRGTTPLHEAASRSNNQEIVAELINAGASVQATCDNGSTPLHRAAADNTSSKMLMALIKAGADVNAKDNEGRTPLFYATGLSAYDSANTIQVLIDAGADINARDNNNITPLLQALICDKPLEILSALINAGANTEVVLNSPEYGVISVFDLLRSLHAKDGIEQELLHLINNQNQNRIFKKEQDERKKQELLAMNHLVREAQQRRASELAQKDAGEEAGLIRPGQQKVPDKPAAAQDQMPQPPKATPIRGNNKFKITFIYGDEVYAKSYIKDDYFITIFRDNEAPLREALTNVKGIARISQ